MLELFTENAPIHRPPYNNRNLIDYSMLRQLKCNVYMKNFAIRYVSSGTELYALNGNKYFVNKNEYILANKFCEGFISIDSKEYVKGLCIDVSPILLSETLASYIQPGTTVPDVELDTYFNTPYFFENKYKAGETRLGALLKQVVSKIESGCQNDLNFNQEFYYTVSEMLVMDHIPVFKQLQKITSIKTTTKKDLYRRLCKGREWIDANFLLPFEVNAVATHSGFSEYHFFRLFKLAFGISPYQYILKKRLAHAYAILQTERLQVSDVSLLCGFANVQGFSKVFKKHFGIQPSKLHE